MRPLLCSAALAAALTVPALATAQATDAASMVPASMNAAGFVNAGKILEEYGMLFDGGPLADKIDEMVSLMDMPDPREEGLQEVAFAGRIDSMDDDRFAFYVTRSPDQAPDLVARFADFFRRSGLGEVEESSYRGVTVYGVRSADADFDSPVEAQAADLSETQAFVSLDKSGEHALTAGSVDTYQGLYENFAQKYGSQLSNDDYATASFELPESFRQDLAEALDGMLAFLSPVEHAHLALSSRGDEVRLALDGRTASEREAQEVKAGLEALWQVLKARFGDQAGDYSFLFDSVEFGQEGTVATISVALPGDLVKDLLSAFTGQDMSVD